MLWSNSHPGISSERRPSRCGASTLFRGAGAAFPLPGPRLARGVDCGMIHP
jgi:hypothetical protein